MIHLDANILIAATNPDDLHAAVADRIMEATGPFGTSACAWTEYRSRPVDPIRDKVLRQMITGGILPFDEATAVLAGELYHLTGSKRRTRLDTMIAATAILAGAELATVDPDDFTVFLAHGLKLHPF